MINQLATGEKKRIQFDTKNVKKNNKAFCFFEKIRRPSVKKTSLLPLKDFFFLKNRKEIHASSSSIRENRSRARVRRTVRLSVRKWRRKEERKKTYGVRRIEALFPLLFHLLPQKTKVEELPPRKHAPSAEFPRK